ncbi:glyceraldehyde 3-phosphate dehydrogenase NAD-binding domain-containing protein [Escherichia coli]
MSKVGINGFGRIGRLVLRRLLEVKSNIDVVAINDSTSQKFSPTCSNMIFKLLTIPWSVDFTEDSLIVDGKNIVVYAEKEAKNIPWKAKGAEIIVECTGFLYLRLRNRRRILDAGAKKVLIPALLVK